MLCVPILSKIQVAKSSLADIFEFRLDFFEKIDIDQLALLRKKIERPVVFTLRKKTQGGLYKKSEKSRYQEIKELCTLAPTYFDLEYDTPASFIEEIKSAFPDIKIILSYHNFENTPKDLESILRQMQHIPAHLYKIATTAQSTNDSLRMLQLIRANAPLLGMCMGVKGEITRILAPVFGSPWTFAYISEDQQSAPGQLPLETFKSVYATHRLKPSTSIYGLIGSPVSKSLSHYTHNKVFQKLAIDAVYVKMDVEPHELDLFFSLAKEIGIRGLSVTMPLKEHVIPFLSHIDSGAKKIGAVNTILLEDGLLSGYNADGKGALDALEDHIKVFGKKIVILGAGGAARALIYEALHRNARVSISNRTKEKALKLSSEFSIDACNIEEEPYDILINTTPSELPIDPSSIRLNTAVMDIKTLPKMTSLLREAAAKKCLLIFGFEMFINQAILQYELWFGIKFNKAEIKKTMEKELSRYL